MRSGVRRMLTVQGWVDLYDDRQRLFLNLEIERGKRAYSKSVSQNVSRTRLARTLEGLWTGGRPALGYVRGEDGRLALGDPEDVETVRWIFARYLEGDVGLRGLAA